MSILLALNCQFMQSSVFAMHFLDGCLLCWCPFRACTTTFYYNTTLTFAGATHKFYAIKIIRYYVFSVFYASFRKCVSFASPFSNEIYSEKKDAVAEENAFTFVIIFFLFLHHSQFLLSFFFVVVVIIIIIIVAIHLWADETSVRIKSNPWDVLLLLLLRCCSVHRLFRLFHSILFCFDYLLACVIPLLRPTFWNDRAFVNY